MYSTRVQSLPGGGASDGRWAAARRPVVRTVAAVSTPAGLSAAGRCRNDGYRARAFSGTRSNLCNHLSGGDRLTRADQTQAEQSRVPPGREQRRRQLLIALATATVAASRPAQAFDFVETKADPLGTRVNANDFEFVVPSDFVDLGVPKPVKPSGFSAGGPGAPAQASPVRARFANEDGSQTVTVLVKEASSVRATFTQLADISDWGSLADVAKLLLPPGTRVKQADVETIERPPRDTRTIRGVVPTPSLNIYKYQFSAPNGTPIAFVACGLKGRLYLLATQGTPGADGPGPHVALALSTFRCKEEFRPSF